MTKYSLEYVEGIIQDHCAEQVTQFIESARAAGVSADELDVAVQIYGEVIQETRREIRAFARGEEPAC